MDGRICCPKCGRFLTKLGSDYDRRGILWWKKEYEVIIFSCSKHPDITLEVEI